MQVATIGLDLAKHVFQIHGIDAAEKVVVRKQLRHNEVIGVLRGSAAVPDRHGARFLLTEFHLNKIFLMPDHQPERPHEPEHSQLSKMELRVRALESVLTQKGYIEPAALDLLIETYEKKIGPYNGARVVAKAWVDEEFKQRLLAEPTPAIASLGYVGFQGEHMVVVENTSSRLPRCGISTCATGCKSHSGLVLRLLFRSLRSLDVGDFRRARLHGCGEHVIDLSPGGANLRCEILTEPALEGPEQRFSDEPVMFRRHAITRMAGPKRFHRRNELI